MSIRKSTPVSKFLKRVMGFVSSREIKLETSHGSVEVRRDNEIELMPVDILLLAWELSSCLDFSRHKTRQSNSRGNITIDS